MERRGSPHSSSNEPERLPGLAKPVSCKEEPWGYWRRLRIGVAKDQVDVALLPSGATWPVNYEDAAVATPVAQLEALQPGCSDPSPFRQGSTQAALIVVDHSAC